MEWAPLVAREVQQVVNYGAVEMHDKTHGDADVLDKSDCIEVPFWSTWVVWGRQGAFTPTDRGFPEGFAVFDVTRLPVLRATDNGKL